MDFLVIEDKLNFELAKVLFEAYFEELQDLLGPQDFEHELLNMEKIYSAPYGLLVLARQDENVLGCIGYKKMSRAACEMKRLYIKPEYRKNKIGGKLVDELLSKARENGFKKMYLDTLPELTGAIKLYEKFGFLECEPYYDSVIKTPIFMSADL